MHTPIPPKVINIDINKYTPADLVHIYVPKFEAVLKRLEVFEVFNFGNEINLVIVDIKNLQMLIERLQRIKHELVDRCSYIKYR